MGYRERNKYNKSNNVNNQSDSSREMSKYFCSKPVFHVILTKIPSIVI